MIPLGSLVYLRDGGRVMLVVDADEQFTVCAWTADGRVIESIIPNHALKIAVLPAA